MALRSASRDINPATPGSCPRRRVVPSLVDYCQRVRGQNTSVAPESQELYFWKCVVGSSNAVHPLRRLASAAEDEHVPGPEPCEALRRQHDAHVHRSVRRHAVHHHVVVLEVGHRGERGRAPACPSATPSAASPRRAAMRCISRRDSPSSRSSTMASAAIRMFMEAGGYVRISVPPTVPLPARERTGSRAVRDGADRCYSACPRLRSGRRPEARSRRRHAVLYCIISISQYRAPSPQPPPPPPEPYQTSVCCQSLFSV